MASREDEVDRDHRRETLAGLRGRVIEIGSGSGPNFPPYPPGVTELVSVEPEANLRAKAIEAAGAGSTPITGIDPNPRRLPLQDGSFAPALAGLGACSG